MKGTRRIILLMLAAILMLTLSACSKKNKDGGEVSSREVSGVASSDTSDADTDKASKEVPEETPKESEVSDTDLSELISKSKTMDNFSWECEITGEAQTISYKFYVKGKKSRIDMGSNDGQEFSIYQDVEKGEMYMYNKAENTAMLIKDDSQAQTQNVIKPDEFLTSVTKGDMSGYKNKGKENFEGMDCTVYEYDIENNKVRIFVWDKYEVVVKVESYEGSKLLGSMILKNYQVDNTTDDMVTVPGNAEIIDLSAMPN